MVNAGLILARRSDSRGNLERGSWQIAGTWFVTTRRGPDDPEQVQCRALRGVYVPEEGHEVGTVHPVTGREEVALGTRPDRLSGDLAVSGCQA
jgi:hypothetical protein